MFWNESRKQELSLSKTKNPSYSSLVQLYITLVADTPKGISEIEVYTNIDTILQFFSFYFGSQKSSNLRNLEHKCLGISDPTILALKKKIFWWNRITKYELGSF